MKLELHTSSIEKGFNAVAIYVNGTVIVLKGSIINTNPGPGYKPSGAIRKLRDDRATVDENGILLKNVEFTSLSPAATFVTGRSANGMTAWKTPNGKYVRYTLRGK